ESLNVTFDETPPPSKTSPLVDDDLDEEEAIRVIKKKNLENDIEDETLEIDEVVNIKESRNHPLENVIGNLNQRTLRNKLDENDVVSQNKDRLVAQGYNQQEGIVYVETYALVARLESIRLLLAYACALDFNLFQMDEKSAFLNGLINEELSNDPYVLYDRVMYLLAAQQEQKTQKDYGTKRGRRSTSSSSAFGQPSSSHLNDDDDDGNDKGTSRASTPSPTFQLRDEQCGGLRSFGKGIKNLLKGKKKKLNEFLVNMPKFASLIELRIACLVLLFIRKY
ncbi:retrovirus-related pol polyprotein from transposon TNT 1-94, partial [Tanacetum coccineum]